MEIIITIKNDEGELSNSKKQGDDRVITEPSSLYAQSFDSSNPNWTNCNRDYNLMFVKQQERFFNDLLKARAEADDKLPVVFLNEVLDGLGFPQSTIGAMVGWVYKENNPIGDNYIDFDIDSIRNQRYKNGESDHLVLDFNVDGVVLDQI